MSNNRLFGNRIKPACKYCMEGFPDQFQNMILCPRSGMAGPDHSCRHFVYDPISRIPRPPVVLEKPDEAEFSID